MENNLMKENYIDFLIKNKTLIFYNRMPSRQDYEIFVECMDIYNKTGENLFEIYNNITNDFIEGEMTKGLQYYFECTCKNIGIDYLDENNFITSYKKKLIDIINGMEVLGLTSLKGVSIDKYKEFFDLADKEFIYFRDLIRKNSREKYSIKNNKIISSYFNFEHFDNRDFDAAFKKCIKCILKKENMYIVEQNAFINNKVVLQPNSIELKENNIFMVYIYKQGELIKIGYTKTLLSYIIENQREIDFDIIYYCSVDEKYLEYIYARSYIYFNLNVTGSIIKNSNPEYTTLNHAKRAYKARYGLNLVSLKKIIKANNLEELQIGDSFILNKSKLHACIMEYLTNHKLK